jgi:serine/threonine protein kinase
VIGRTISHYKITEKVGGGAMGVVYGAEDLRLNRPVALKFLPTSIEADEDRKRRFLLEAKAASALDHPNICTIHQIDETDDGQMFIVMSHYKGETLKGKIDRGPLPLDDALHFARQTAQGLAKARQAGIVHRDIKPANLLVTTDGVVKILDFGLALLVEETKITMPGSLLGTPAYMSPEQAQGGDVTHRTDIWSLGVVLYEMVSGKRPFKGEYQSAIIYSLLHEPPPPLTDLPFAPIVVVLLMMAVLIVLGLFMDWVGILLLTMPIFVPIIESLGYDPIWFGILFCINMQISYLSPPFGPAAFYLKSVAPPEISLQDIYRSLWPFMLMQITVMLLVMAFPQIALWLPEVLMRGG